MANLFRCGSNQNSNLSESGTTTASSTAIVSLTFKNVPKQLIIYNSNIPYCYTFDGKKAYQVYGSGNTGGLSYPTFIAGTNTIDLAFSGMKNQTVNWIAYY